MKERSYSQKGVWAGILLCVLAFLLCWFGLGLMFAAALIGIVYAMSDLTGAALASASVLLGTITRFGLNATPLTLILCILPGWLYVVLLRRDLPCVKAMRIAFAAGCAMLLASACILRLLIHGDVIDAMIAQTQQWFAALPLEVRLQVLANLRGFQGASTINGFQAMGLLLQQQTIMDAALSQLGRWLHLFMPAVMTVGALLMALWGYCVPLYIMTGAGSSRKHPAKPLASWRLPLDALAAAPLLSLVCRVLYGSGLEIGADSAFYVFWDLTSILYAIQGLSAIGRSLRRSKTSRTRKNFTYVSLIVLAHIMPQALTILCAIGASSAVFGSQGMLRRLSQKDQQFHDKGDGEK